ncbi:MAG: hypothetical protein R2780_10960 [Crocinitomicaceae bacterium]|nr:hypothetical protein [Crocinitomicaceae bacterium]
MKKILVIAVLLAGAFYSCKNHGNKPCSEERETAAIIGEFPDSIKADETYTLKVKYVIENSCGSFNRFEVSQMEDVFTVKLISKYEGCSCNLEFAEGSVDFDISIDFPGIYEYKFWQAEGEYDERTITVYE